MSATADRNHRLMPGHHRVDDTPEHPGQGQRAGRIVHQNHIGIGAGREAGTHRLAAMAPPGTTVTPATAHGREPPVQRERQPPQTRRSGAGDPGDTMLQNRRTAEIDKRFRGILPEPYTGPRSGNNPPTRARPPTSPASDTRSGRRSQNLVENARGLLVVGVLCQRQLIHEHPARTRQDALLTRRQAPVLLTTPQVTHDLGDLDDVARVELLLICLEPTCPVGGLLGVRGPQNLEDLVETSCPTTSRTPTS